MTALSSLSGSLRLTDLGLIRAHGADARSFLHGQLTQDMQHLAAGQARLAGYCSAKGRLLASFIVWPGAGDELLLACSADLLPATLKRLSMFVLRAKCKLEDLGTSRSLWGAVGDAAAGLVGAAAPWQVLTRDGHDCVRLPDALVQGQAVPRCLIVAPADATWPETLEAQAWLALEARSGVASIVAATSEQFVPQMVNLELVGGVNFQKGCYPGQEVVARSQYRGTLKRRMFLFDVDAEARAGQELFHSADPGQPAGLVANAARRPGGGSRVLAEVKLAALDAGSLHLGDAAALLGGPGLRLAQRGPHLVVIAVAPVGALRVDVAYGVDLHKWRLEVSLGIAP